MSAMKLFLIMSLLATFLSQYSISQTPFQKPELKRLSNHFLNLSNFLEQNRISIRMALRNFDNSCEKVAISRDNYIQIVNKAGEAINNFSLSNLNLEKPINFTWNSAGTQALFLANRIGKRNRLLARLLMGGELEILIDDPEAEILQPDWSPNDDKIVFLRSQNGTKIIVLDLDSKKQTVVSDPGGGNAVWFHTQNKIAYAKTEFNRNSRDVRNLWLYDFDSGSNEVLFENFNSVFPVISPDDSFILVLAGPNFAMIDLNGKITKKFAGSIGVSESISPNGKHFAYLKGIIEGDPGRLVEQHLHVVDIASGEDYDLTPESLQIIENYLWYSSNVILY